MMAFLELFLTFFTIGIVTFGGGYAMLPMIQSEVAARWGELIPSADLINFVAVSESTPGPFAVNMATYVGSVVGQDALGDFWGSVLGAFCSTMGVVLPSFIVILIVAKCYDRFKQSSLVKGAMSGLKPAVVGLIANAVLKVVKEVFIPGGFVWGIFTTSAFWISAALFAVMAMLAFKKVHPIIIICISAAAGILFGCLGWL